MNTSLASRLSKRSHSFVRHAARHPARTCGPRQSEASTAPQRTRARQGTGAAAAAASGGAVATDAADAAERNRATVLAFYEAFNSGDTAALADCFADEVVYHDAIYLEPYFGKTAVLAFFDKFGTVDGLQDLKFSIQEVVADGEGCAAAWHSEVDGGFVPFSRGVSFYKLDGAGRITWARDCVEASPPKPGDGTLVALKGLLPVLRAIGVDNANPAKLTDAPLASAAVWAFYVGYIAHVMLSTTAPGNPAYNVDPAVFSELAHQSLNFFYVNVGANALGFDLIPSIAEHPVSEALFNFVNAWGVMFLPVIAADAHAQRNVPRWGAWWGGIMALTNVFFIPFLALRARPAPHASGLDAGARTAASLSATPPPAVREGLRAAASAAPEDDGCGEVEARWAAAARACGAVALAVGGVSIAWAAVARPEYGDLAARWAYAVERFQGERVFYAFVLDTGLYAVWQATLLGAAGAPARFRFTPFFGLAVWLLSGRPRA